MSSHILHTRALETLYRPFESKEAPSVPIVQPEKVQIKEPTFTFPPACTRARPKLSVVVVKKRISSRFFALLGGKVSNPPPGTVIDTEVTRPEWWVGAASHVSSSANGAAEEGGPYLTAASVSSRYDFYIVSQAVNNGSVSPTHYNVVYDTSGLKPDHMQRLTYKLCHMYFNWQVSKTLPASVPPGLWDELVFVWAVQLRFHENWRSTLTVVPQGTIRVPAPCQYAHKLAFLVGQSIHKEPDVKLDDLLFYLWAVGFFSVCIFWHLLSFLSLFSFR